MNSIYESLVQSFGKLSATAEVQDVLNADIAGTNICPMQSGRTATLLSLRLFLQGILI
ncbi:MAG: hypothetical protein HOP36_10775 [Methyloglobulus sp.]|nr:hypothetical protein [Methyloglobulus sp.]